MSPGTPRSGGISVRGRGSGYLPGERTTESNPKRVAVRGLEHAAAVTARLALPTEYADVDSRDPLLKESSEDASRGVCLHGEQECAFADCIERIHGEQLRHLEDGRMDKNFGEVDLHAQARRLGHLPHGVANPALRRVVHGPYAFGPESDRRRREGVVDRAHGFE